MEMTWIQTLTIIFSMAGMQAWFWRASTDISKSIREDMKEAREDMREIREDMRENSRKSDAEFQETRKLWASLLQKSYVVEQEIRDLMKKL